MTTASSSAAVDRTGFPQQIGAPTGRRLRNLGLALALGFAASTQVQAHRIDEYLHAAFVAIRPAGVELQLSLTPGQAVAEAVLVEMDSDRDGRVSELEQRAYAESILKHLRIDIDDAAALPRLESVRFPEVSAVRDGVGVVELKAAVPCAPFAEGAHRFRIQNRHTNHSTIHLANALQPETAEIEIVRQTRDFTQSELVIEFTAHPLHPATPKVKRPWLPIAVIIGLGAALAATLSRRSKPARN